MEEIFKNLDENYIIYNSKIISVISDNNEKIWFNAHEVCEALGYKNPKLTIINNIDKKDKIQLEKINTNIKINKHPHSIYITESGLYSLIFTSRLKSSVEFREWITHEILPSIRKHGIYKLKQGFIKEKNDIMKKINYYERQVKLLNNDLKKNKFPEGALLYVLDYSENNTEIYRIGKTDDLNKRKQIYDSHTLHKKNVIHYTQITNPIKLEMCVRAMLYDFRYKDKKDFYVCKLKTIKDAIKVCVQEQKNMSLKNQKGGGGNINHNILINEIVKMNRIKKNIEEKIIQIDDKLQI